MALPNSVFGEALRISKVKRKPSLVETEVSKQWRHDTFWYRSLPTGSVVAMATSRSQSINILSSVRRTSTCLKLSTEGR